MSFAFPTFTQSAAQTRQRYSKPKQSVLDRVWRILLKAGQRRAAYEVARQVRLLDGRPTGNLEQDVQQLAALRGLR